MPNKEYSKEVYKKALLKLMSVFLEVTYGHTLEKSFIEKQVEDLLRGTDQEVCCD